MVCTSFHRKQVNFEVVEVKINATSEAQSPDGQTLEVVKLVIQMYRFAGPGLVQT